MDIFNNIYMTPEEKEELDYTLRMAKYVLIGITILSISLIIYSLIFITK